MALDKLISLRTFALSTLGFALLLASPAKAGLIGNGTNTVNALFYLGSHTPGSAETEDYGSPPVAGPATIPTGGVTFVEGALDGSTIFVGDTQIVITNELPPTQPFCSTSSTPCPDTFTGFEFQFSAGVDISAVTVDPASAPAFLPVAGGLTSSATDILVNVVGDAPDIGEQLILDLSFPTATSVSEPAAFALTSLVLSGLVTLALRKRRFSR